MGENLKIYIDENKDKITRFIYLCIYICNICMYAYVNMNIHVCTYVCL
jgi:hypothetical protein